MLFNCELLQIWSRLIEEINLLKKKYENIDVCSYDFTLIGLNNKIKEIELLSRFIEEKQ
jgi:hypothetical protein